MIPFPLALIVPEAVCAIRPPADNVNKETKKIARTFVICLFLPYPMFLWDSPRVAQRPHRNFPTAQAFNLVRGNDASPITHRTSVPEFNYIPNHRAPREKEIPRFRPAF